MTSLNSEFLNLNDYHHFLKIALLNNNIEPIEPNYMNWQINTFIHFNIAVSQLMF